MLKSSEASSEISYGNSHVNISYRKPDVLKAVTEAVERHESDGRVGRLAVVSCGPARMAEDARVAAVKMLSEGHSRLDFFPESFNW